MQEIKTERLILRNFSVSDVDGMIKYLTNPRADCYLDIKIAEYKDAVEIAKEKSNDDSHIAVCLKDSNRNIGELFCDKEEMDTYSVCWNFDICYEGKGYAYESAEALFRYLFLKKGARRIYAYVADDNFRSWKLCERLGMRREGHMIEFISFTNYPDGTPKYENTYQYALLKKEWYTEK